LDFLLFFYSFGFFFLKKWGKILGYDMPLKPSLRVFGYKGNRIVTLCMIKGNFEKVSRLKFFFSFKGKQVILLCKTLQKD